MIEQNSNTYYYVGLKRDTHRCTLGGKWAKPDKVQVTCILDKDAIDALQLSVTRLQSEVLHLQAQSIIDAERIFHCKLPKNVYVGT